MRISKLLTISVFFIAICSSINAQEIWTLQRCLEYAKENNLQIKQQEIQIQQSQNNLLQSKLDFLPTISGSMGHNMNWGRSVNLQDLEIITNKLSQSTSLNFSGSLTIFDGLANVNTLKSSKVQLEISQGQIEKLKNEITISITRAYLQVLLSKEIEKTAQQNFLSIQEQVERTRKTVNAGSQPYTALLDMEAQLAQERLQLVNATNSVESNLLTLIQLLDLEYTMAFMTDAPDLDYLTSEFGEKSVNSIYAKALDLPQIKIAELELSKSKLQYKIQKGGALPQIRVSAGYGTFYSDGQSQAFFSQFNDNKNPSLGFNLSIPIFNGWRYNTNTRNARLNVKSTEIELKRTQNNLYKEVQQAYIDAKASYQKMIASEQNMKASQESFSITEKRFNLGMLNGTDYTVAKANLFKAQAEYYQNKFQYILLLKILDFYNGIAITL